MNLDGEWPSNDESTVYEKKLKFSLHYVKVNKNE